MLSSVEILNTCDDFYLLSNNLTKQNKGTKMKTTKTKDLPITEPTSIQIESIGDKTLIILVHSQSYKISKPSAWDDVLVGMKIIVMLEIYNSGKNGRLTIIDRTHTFVEPITIPNAMVEMDSVKEYIRLHKVVADMVAAYGC